LIAVDTNVLLRYLFHADDPAQGELAITLVDGAAQRGEPVFVSTLVLCELAWTLKAAFGVDRAGLLATILRLLAHGEGVSPQGAVPRFTLEGQEILQRAVDDFARGKAEFSDYVIGRAGEAAGATTTFTFDRVAAAAPTFKRLKKRTVGG
jgi:predicted nucleic-acid-binding protein